MNSYKHRIHVTLEKLKGQSRMDNSEKLATLGTQNTRRRNAQQKTSHYTQTNTNNVNET